MDSQTRGRTLLDLVFANDPDYVTGISVQKHFGNSRQNFSYFKIVTNKDMGESTKSREGKLPQERGRRVN